MNLKEKVSTFRSQMLMGRYSKSIQLGIVILNQIEKLQQVGVVKIDTLYQNIKQQLQITKKLSSQMSIIKDEPRKKAVSKWERKQKNNLNQIVKSKWSSPKSSLIKSEDKKYIYENEEIEEQNNQNLQNQEQRYISQQSVIEQQLHRQIILPLNMPELFKLKTHFPLIVVDQSHIQNVLSYLKTYDFQLIKTLSELNKFQVCELIVQINKRSILRSVMIFQQSKCQVLSQILQQISLEIQIGKSTLIFLLKQKQGTKQCLQFR